MIISQWFHVHEKLPNKSGNYLTYIGPSLGDDYATTRRCHFDKPKSTWASHGEWANVRWWCDVTFSEPDHKLLSKAEQIALDNVNRAIQNYELIKNLS